MKFRTIWFMFLAMMDTTSFAIVEKKTYVVHMDKTKVVTSNLKQWHEDLMDSIHNLSIEEEEEEEGTTPPELLYIYENAISGFSAKLSTKQFESLKRMDGFLFATVDKMVRAHTTHTPQFLGLQFNKGLWSESNLASDIVIGVIDSGIWPEHISFQEHSGMAAVPSRWNGTCENGTMFSSSNCNKKLIGARYFYKGYEASYGRINETYEFLSPRDANGHGTHTAATAGGNVANNASLFGFASGSASGMMYTSRIAVYKALWGTRGRGAISDILASMDQAVADGVDVLSLSLGGGDRPYYLDFIAIASFGAINKGISVVCSAGNLGPDFYTVSNSAPWIMTIAASYLDRSFPTTIKLGNGHTFEGSSLYTGNPTSQLPLVYGKTAGGENAEYCIPGSLNHTLVKGKIVLCLPGTISDTATGEQVKLAGGAGMLLIEELFAGPHVLPATSTGLLAGIAITEYVNSTNEPTASIDFHGTVYGTRAPMMAAFSSRGPNIVGLDVIKPDVTAPGMNILAAWPPIISPSKLPSDKRRVMFNIISGTSMSCPHVSGIVGLLKSFRKHWSPAAIKSALMTTAYTTDNTQSPIIDVASNSEPATPFHFGSGHINPEAAADPGLIYDITPEDYLNYLCSLNYTYFQIAAIARSQSPFVCPENLTLQPGDLNYPSFAVNFVGEAKNLMVTYTRTVTNVGTPRSNYLVLLEEPSGVAVMVEPKMLEFKKLGQKLSYKVTFVGYKRVVNSLNASFGSLVWVHGKYVVRSPIAVTWDAVSIA